MTTRGQLKGEGADVPVKRATISTPWTESGRDKSNEIGLIGIPGDDSRPIQQYQPMKTWVLTQSRFLIQENGVFKTSVSTSPLPNFVLLLKSQTGFTCR